MKIADIVSSFSKRTNLSQGVVGVDVGASAIKVVEIQEHKGVPTLTSYGEVQLGPYAGKEIGAAVSLEVNEEQTALLELIKKAAVKAPKGVFSMPLSSSFVTNVQLEVEPDTDLAPMVQVEARKVIPSSLSEVALDWAEVDSIVPVVDTPESEEVVKENRGVLIAAIQNSALERYKVLMQYAGLTEPPTEIECFSTIRALHRFDTPVIAVLDIGADSAKLFIASNGVLVRMYRIRAGGAAVTAHIAEARSLSFVEAEEQKRSTERTSSDHGPFQQLHEQVYDRALREFRQVLKEYEDKTGQQIAVIYLAGGVSAFPGFDALLRERFDREVRLAHPFARVAYPAFMEKKLSEIGPSFTVATGAALRLFE